MTKVLGITIKTAQDLRKGYVMASIKGRVSWFGPIDRFPSDRVIDEVTVHPTDFVRIQAEMEKCKTL